LREKIKEFAIQPGIDDLRVKGVSLEADLEYSIGFFKNITDFVYPYYFEEMI
jgi:hypothetical protein